MGREGTRRERTQGRGGVHRVPRAHGKGRKVVDRKCTSEWGEWESIDSAESNIRVQIQGRTTAALEARSNNAPGSGSKGT